VSKLPRPNRHSHIARRTMTRKRARPDPHTTPRKSGMMRFSSHLPRHVRERYEVITGQTGPRKSRRGSRR